jgi:hypothetical protein
MTRRKPTLCLAAALLLPLAAIAGSKKGATAPKPEELNAQPMLWRDGDIASRDLFNGPGGKEHQPHGPFTFEKEDLDGTNPKFVALDADGVKWKAKVGAEARPETAATRLVWAAGYFANEDYFLPTIHVDHLPPHLHRGQKFADADGTVHNVRLKRYLKGEEKIGNWDWRSGPFAGTRELDGLRVMMALINNWDLTEENNAIYKEKAADGPDSPRIVYMVSDLGSTFGTAGLTWPTGKARGNLHTYSHSLFIAHVGPDSIDLHAPHRDSLVFLATPHEYMQKVHLAWIGKNIPREHARWIGDVLSRLSRDQIREAFRAAGYSLAEIDGFTDAVQHRIAELKAL